jgi:hypothetical protein
LSLLGLLDKGPGLLELIRIQRGEPLRSQNRHSTFLRYLPDSSSKDYPDCLD